jgi:hypothetical protein
MFTNDLKKKTDLFEVEEMSELTIVLKNSIHIADAVQREFSRVRRGQSSFC